MLDLTFVQRRWLGESVRHGPGTGSCIPPKLFYGGALNSQLMHRNNFDSLRLLFAVFVVISHSHALSGSGSRDWLANVTGEQTELAYLGVRGFFVISGFLIFQSLRRSRTIAEYFWKRALRLYPGLVVVLALTVLLASIPYEGHILTYATSKGTWAYFLNNLSLIRLQYGINGVFDNNPFARVINGSLWTIPYEVLLYIVLSSLIGVKTQRTARIVLGAAFVLLFLANFLSRKVLLFGTLMNFGQFVNLGAFFAAGGLLASLEINAQDYRRMLFFIGTLLLAGSLLFGVFDKVQFIAIPMTVIGFGMESTRFLIRASERLGDLSYGFYIYNFPIQQALVYYLRPTQLELLGLSLILTSLFSYLSWHYIEAKALKYKTHHGKLMRADGTSGRNIDISRPLK